MIATLEEISLNALPALQTFFYDGWIVRMGKGYSRRANSVQTFLPSTRPLDEKIAYCETLYRRSNLPVVFKMTSASQPPELDRVLDARGYETQGRTCVQTCDLTLFPGPLRFLETSRVLIEISEKWQDEWFQAFCRMNNPTPEQQTALEKMLKLILAQTAFAFLSDEHGVRACGLGVLQERYLGLFDIVVDSSARRHGYGRQLVSHLMSWGKARGAQTAYLQVVAGNVPAQQLYAQLGFVEQYQYWYRTRL